MTSLLKTSMLVAALTTASCYVEARLPTATIETSDGELVEVGEGVEVLADRPQAIFFVDDYYWWYLGGVWYSSPWYRGGWTRAPRVPEHLHGIRHPEQYAHFRPDGWAPRHVVRGTVPSRTVTVRSRLAPHGHRPR